MSDPLTHYGSHGHGECGATFASVTMNPEAVTCRTCRGWLPIVVPAGDAVGAPQQERAWLNKALTELEALDFTPNGDPSLSGDAHRRERNRAGYQWLETNRVAIAALLRSTSLPSVGRSEERQKLLAEYNEARGRYLLGASPWDGASEAETLRECAPSESDFVKAADKLASYIRSSTDD